MKSDSVIKDRDKYIGGSDVPILMNLSPFKKRWQLLKEKAEPSGDGIQMGYMNRQIEYGNEMEEKIRGYINEKYDCKFTPEVKIKDDLRGNCDGLYEDTILEIKTTSIIHKNVDEYKSYLVQLLFYMVLWEKENGMLAVYERPEDYSTRFKHKRLNIYRINIADYEELVADIFKQIDKFREDLAILRGNPFLTEEEMMPTDMVELADRAIVFETQLKALKEVEKRVKEIKAQLKDAMQSAGIKTWTTNSGVKLTLVPDGEPTVEWKFDEDAFAEANPQLHKHYTKPVQKKGKTGYVLITIPKDKCTDS